MAESDDRRVVRALAATWQAYREADETLTLRRKYWSDERKRAKAGLELAMSADDDGSAGSARAKLDAVCGAWQLQQEVEAGRKAELHDLICASKDAAARLDKQAEGAQQLLLFDEDGVMRDDAAA